MLNIALDCFPNGNKKALVMSYDDGVDHDRRLVEIFNGSGIRGTFHMISGAFGKPGFVTAEEVAALYKGHEVSVHTVTHPQLTQVPTERVIWEMAEDRKSLEHLVGYPVRGMSYPFGTYDERIKAMLPALGIAYARGPKATNGFDLPDDFLQWQPTCHHNDELLEVTKRFLTEDRCGKLALLNVFGHSHDLERDQSWGMMEQFCQFIGQRSDIWYTSYMDIYHYMQATRNLEFSMDCEIVYNPSAISVWLSVEDEPYCIKAGATIKVGKSV